MKLIKKIYKFFDKRVIVPITKLFVGIGNKLNKLGYNVKILDYSEIVKGEGSIDCCTLSLLRE